MSKVFGKERIIRMQVKAEDPTAFDAKPLAQYVNDLIRERDELLDIIRIQVESSGDCSCDGCKRGRQALETARAM